MLCMICKRRFTDAMFLFLLIDNGEICTAYNSEVSRCLNNPWHLPVIIYIHFNISYIRYLRFVLFLFITNSSLNSCIESTREPKSTLFTKMCRLYAIACSTTLIRSRIKRKMDTCEKNPPYMDKNITLKHILKHISTNGYSYLFK